MKMAFVSTIVSGIASLGVLIGLISGIFFLVLSALRWVSRVRATVYEEELQRQKRLLDSNSYLTGSIPPNLEAKENGFRNEAPENFFLRAEERSKMEDSTQEEATEKQGTKITDTVQVREFIEKLVETIIGGPLDGITVGKLSSHAAYKNSTEFDSSNSMQSSLKRLIKKVVSEAMCLPDIKDVLCHSETTNETPNEDFENKSYEDILATAILNKVIENFQARSAEKEGIKENENRHYPRQRLKRSQDDDPVYSSDWSDSSPTDKLSLTIEEYIEEVTTAYEVSDDEKCDLSDYEATITRRVPFPESGRIVRDVGTDDENSDTEEKSSATELITSTSSWEENWLFQKKRLRSTPNAHHPVPVPMLVPNPSEDYRALVGGVDADDLSDMSDCSDLILDDDSHPTTPTVPQRTVLSFLNIAPEDNEEENEKSAAVLTNGVNNESNTEEIETVGEAEKERSLEEISEENKRDSSSPTSPEVLSQKDREFSVEDFNLSHQCESNDQTSSQWSSMLLSNYESDNSMLRCRIAEREKEKWNNPVPIPDNPYSPENIEKREQRNKIEYFRVGTASDSIDFPSDLLQDELDGTSSESSRFTRDYYINASKHPSGISSPSSLNQLSASKEQDTTREIRTTIFGSPQESISDEMQEKHNVSPKPLVVNRKEFSLPNVKELAKQFTAENQKDKGRVNKKPNTETKLESKNTYVLTHLRLPEKEPEIDYSTVPVSEIIFNLQHASKPLSQIQKHAYHIQRPNTQMEIRRKTNGNFFLEKRAEKKVEPADGVRFNGKEVHSLTARSISREFREGLKNNCYQRVPRKVDRNSSSGESDVVSDKLSSSPTPSVDLRNMKKFWEEIITANSNSLKQK